MSASAPNFWSELFESKGAEDFTQTVRVINKAGEPWLILPDAPGMAAQALALYPAQTKLAKAARWALGATLKLNLPLGSSRVKVSLTRDDAFARFLCGLVSPGKENSFPPLAILAGNVRAVGRRFIVLLFDGQERPVFVVKAGVGEAARELVRREILFLRSVAAGVAGLPVVRSVFVSARVEALALGYVAGDSPDLADLAGVGKLLSGWVNPAKRVCLEELGAWQRLAQAHGDDPILRELADALKGSEFCATLFHGDFAPWNIKVTTNGWTALDWERGELTGFPAWDWFHYVVQSGILVEKLPAEALARRLESLFNEAAFRQYADRAKIAGREKVLAAAYLFYCVRVLRPTEGAEVGEQLLAVAMKEKKWLSR
jgi:hypothetical protein